MSGYAGVELRTVDIDGRTIAYRRSGAGPPLLLLHGAWSDSRDWRPQLEGLADDFDVIAWDAPGCGGSWDPPEDFGLSGYADAAADFVRALGIERAHVLGLSFGGGLAIEISHRHPELPSSVVLAGAYAGWAGSLPADVVEERLTRVLREAELPPEEWIASYLPSFFSGPVAQERVDEVVEIMRDVRAAGTKAMLIGFAQADLRDVLDYIAVPTLVLHAELDERSPRRVADELHQRIPNSELVVLPGVGHVSNIEAPEAFNAAVRLFLKAVRFVA